MPDSESSDFLSPEETVGLTIGYVTSDNCGNDIEHPHFVVESHGEPPKQPKHRCTSDDVRTAEIAWSREPKKQDDHQRICLLDGAMVECTECHRRYWRYTGGWGEVRWSQEGYLHWKRRMRKQDKAQMREDVCLAKY